MRASATPGAPPPPPPNRPSQELLLVNDETQRFGLLKQALTTDWEGAAPLPASGKQPPSRG